MRVLEAAGLPTEAVPEEDRKPTRDAVAAAFHEELKHANEPGAKVMSADRELRYCLELQQKRIANRSLRFTDEMVPGAYFQEGFNNVRSWQDGQYETSWSVGFVEHTKTFDRPNMKPYKKKEPQAIYETVVDVRSGEDVSDDTYCCPNCGSVSTIRELQEGCSHCGTASEPASDDWVIHEVKEAGQTYMLKPLIIVLAILVLIVIGGLANLGIIH